MNSQAIRIGAFGATVLASGWIGVGLNRLMGVPDSMDSLGTLVWITAPGIAALAMTASDPALRCRAPRSWLPGRPASYLPALALFPVVTAASLAISKLLGWVDLSNFNPAAIASGFTAGIVGGIIKNVAEEGAWRGYLVPRLDDAGLPDAAVYVGSGLIWGLWHLPYFLFFLPRDELRGFTDLPAWAFALIATGVMVVWAIPYTELRRASGSIWPGVVMHAIEDATVNPIITGGHAVIAPGRTWFASPVTGIVSTALLAGAGLAMRWARLRRQGAAKAQP